MSMHHRKNWFNCFFVVVLLAVFQSCAFAADNGPTGVWKTYNADGNATSLTKITINNDELQGVVQKVLPVNGRVVKTCENCQGENQGKPLVGMTVAWGFHSSGNGQWTGGNVLEVRTGKVRPANLTVSPDGNTINVTVSSGPFTRTVQWVREQ